MRLDAGVTSYGGRSLSAVKAHGLGRQYIGSDFVDSRCPGGQVALHADAAHKNELTLQQIFQALRGVKAIHGL